MHVEFTLALEFIKTLFQICNMNANSSAAITEPKLLGLICINCSAIANKNQVYVVSYM